MRFGPLLLLVVLFFGCRTSGSAESSSHASPNATATLPDCSSSRPPDRRCTQDSDCAIVTRNKDCCGSELSTGVNVHDRARYEAQEQMCPTVVRACRCAAAPTSADDGTSATQGTLSVACVSGTCTTSYER